MNAKQYFVFDIETVGLPLNSFDESQQEYLLRSAATDEERDKKIREFALSPLTAQVVCIGIMVVEWDGNNAPEVKRQGAFILDETLAQDEKKTIYLSENMKAQASCESILLDSFWKILDQYFAKATLVSFNGKEFDAPFLMLRSAACRVRPSHKIVDINKSWDKEQKHIDLLKEFTFNARGANTTGATRSFNFDFYTRAFGIASPKASGVHGGNIAEFYAQGRIQEIAEYCMRDVHATWELYCYWHRYLNFST
ncbi:MAG: ribonuclease H-like domain-containing protein [Bacteroidota bacterium]|nr:ribonuclease H-like domain-containing protein [Candidatus Kapabacteria bacterium]MDW8220757.1 ribonuclease H-like domain-containing protein [Bacteroidota bacterium]